ncbi:MAG: DUF58 domain-containing protein [Deltaproteobacteria bacterium]|nr:DUF58 domain-containing protein [Deltaproteobacteria bacterium]MBN2670857.1 DUF58 domain-containing protein [Deltaproteobacteria bacterium]
MNFARFNHVLVPQSAHERLAWLTSRRGRFLRGGFHLYLSLTPLGRGLLLFWLFAGALGLNVSDTVCYVMWAVVTGVLAASLAVRRYYPLRDVTIQAVAPNRVSVGAELEIEITLHSAWESYAHVQVEAPFLTWDGTYISERQMVTALPRGQTVTHRATARFSARGIHSLMPVFASRSVPWGVAAGPICQSEILDFVVVPTFPKIVNMQLPRAHRCQPRGVPMASSTGEALELGGVRPYQAGDRVRDLHARTWARTGIPHVRQYQQEYFSRVGVVLDVNAIHVSEKQFEAAVSLCAGILAHVADKEALIDVMCIGNNVHSLTIGRSLGFLAQALDLLATVTPGDAFSLELIQPRLYAQMASLSSVVMVCLSVDDSVLRIREWLTQLNIPVRLLVVQPDMSTVPAYGTLVTPAQIASGEELRL